MGLDISTGVYAARKKCGYTQAEMGKAVGVNANTISSYERGKTQPSMDIIMKIADIAGFSLEEVLKYSDFHKHIIREFEEQGKVHIDFMGGLSTAEFIDRYKGVHYSTYYRDLFINNNTNNDFIDY